MPIKKVKYMSYGYTLVFTRKHTKGFLKNIIAEDFIKFCTKEAALNWVDGVSKISKKVGYEILNYRIEKLGA